MIFSLDEYDYYVCCGRTDMRKGAFALAAIVQQEMQLDVFSKTMFLFCGSGHKVLKILFWDNNGFSLFQKRLQTGTFAWPKDEAEAKKIMYDDIKRLLQGEDVFRRIPVLSGSYLL